MQITATEFKNNFGKYLELSNKEKIYITKNGKEVAILSGSTEVKLSALNGLAGVINDPDLSKEQIKNERLSK